MKKTFLFPLNSFSIVYKIDKKLDKFQKNI